ncbi:uncharacterized protein LOC108841201 [Raphanus sativus]|uniref:Uncharacterized protein LOC108841201 n=1 Tax=Raphanus sativus TaxID=3726 RepID=A0A6J0MAS2_RAPSA|nr:uncharacterized protein LOC108841201 [Raphanus sativus]
MRWEKVQRQVGLADSSSSGPGKRWGHTCNATKGGRFVYVFGGFGSDGRLTNQVHVFDAERQIWTEPMIRGVPPSPRDGHSCTTVRNYLFVFGGTDGKDYLNDLHVLDTSSHTWQCFEVRGEEPYTREAHSATLLGKYIFIFGGCGKVPGLDDEVFYNDLYILDTETITWQRALTTGTRPFERDGHTCSTWNKKIIVLGGEHFDGDYLSDVHVLDTATFAWKQLKTSGEVLTPRGGHVTVAIESKLFVFGGFADTQNLYNDLYVLDLETCVWSKIAMEEGPSARFSAAAACLGPYKAGSFFFFGGCNNLEPLDDIYYLHTDGVYETPGRLSSNRHHSSVQTEGPSSSSRKRTGMLDADCDDRAKTQRTLSKDSAGSSQQADPIEPLRNEMPTDVGGAAAEADPGGDPSPQTQDEGRVAAEDADAEQ